MAKSALWAELRRNLDKQTKGQPLTLSAAGRRVRAERRKADAEESAKFSASIAPPEPPIT